MQMVMVYDCFKHIDYQWIGLRDILKLETIDFHVTWGFPVNCSLNQSIEIIVEDQLASSFHDRSVL